MSKALRVLHVIPSLSPHDGGPTEAVALIERALCAAGVSVTTLTTDHDIELVEAKELARQSPAQRIYVHKWTNIYKAAPGAIPRLANVLRDHDIVHIHALFSFTSTVTAWMARALKVPYIVKPHGTLNGYGLSRRRRRLKGISLKLIENEILRHASAVHFTSDEEVREVECLGVKTKSVVIPLAVEAIGANAAGVSGLRELLPGERKIVLFLSRLDPKKNLEGLIDAFAASEKLREKAALVIAGSGEARYTAALQNRVRAAGLGDITVWLGHIEGASKASAFAAADMFALPSYSESFGIAAAEALIAGKPCVLGRGVAIATNVQDAGAGFAVTPETIPLTHALEHLVSDDALVHDMGCKARELAEKEFSVPAMVRRLLALYEGILKVRQSSL